LGRLDSAAAGLAALTAAAHDGELDRASAVAAVAEARALAAVLKAAELAAIDAARAAGATWNELAAAIGVRGRQGALKRRADLARRAPAAGPARRVPSDAGDAAPAGSPQAAAPPPPTADAQDGGTAGGEESPRWPTDEEYSRTLRHHPVAGLGPEWTYTEDDRGNVILWREKTTKAGGARRNFGRGGGWEATSPRLFRIAGDSQPSRVKALRAAAADFEGRRRKVTPAGPDVPLPGAGGWALRQTLAERDERRWRVVAPDGTVAGVVRPSYAGARSWAATHGDPDSGGYYAAPVSPAGEDEAGLAAGDSLDWKTRDAAAYGHAHWHDPDGAPPASLAVVRAAEARKEKQERNAAP
jgi:hypothetical protein